MTDNVTADEPNGVLNRFAIECALHAAWRTEYWIPGDPDFGFTDYFDAAVTRNIGLLRGFEELGEDINRRGILPQTDSDQARLVTDGGSELGVECDVDGCETHVVGLEDGWEMDRGTVCQDCTDYHDRHGHWPDEDVEICAECRIDDGMIAHDCDETGADRVLLEPGSECNYCGYEAPVTDGGENIDRFHELPTPDRFFMQIEPAEIEMQPMAHDDVEFKMQFIPGGKFGVELSAHYSYAGRDCIQNLSLDREGAEALHEALGKALESRRR